MADAGGEKEPGGSPQAGGAPGLSEQKKGLVRELASQIPYGRRLSGYVDPKIVRDCLFVLIVASLVAGTAVSVLGIWGYLEADVVARTLATIGVVVLGSLLFWLTNEVLGN